MFNPELKGVPFAVCGSAEDRHGIVLAKNELAKKAGVQTAETIGEAKKKIPSLHIVAPDFKKYAVMSKRAFELYLRCTSALESFGLDECWLDLTDSERLFGSGEETAEVIRRRVKDELGLTVSIGVSFTKTFAKLGSDIKKPDAVTIINKENFKKIIWKLPVSKLLYVGGNTENLLRKYHIRTIGEIANSDRRLLSEILGKNGEKLYDVANGSDGEPIAGNSEADIPDSISNGVTPPKDITDIREAKALIYSLCEVVAFRLRNYGLSALGVYIGIRDYKFDAISRQTKINFPTDDAQEIADVCVDLIESNYTVSEGRPVRALTAGVYNLMSSSNFAQSGFFDRENIAKTEINRRLDNLRKKYGFGILKRAIELDPEFSCDAREIDSGFVPFDRKHTDKG